MAKPDELQLLKARIKALEVRTQGIAADLEKLELKHSDIVTMHLNLCIRVGDVRRNAEWEDKLTDKTLNRHHERLGELRERVTAVEACLFESDGYLAKSSKTLKDVHRIIGPPNKKTPEKLDRGSSLRRRRK